MATTTLNNGVQMPALGFYAGRGEHRGEHLDEIEAALRTRG